MTDATATREVPGCPKCGAPAHDYREYGRCRNCKEPYSNAFDAVMRAYFAGCAGDVTPSVPRGNGQRYQAGYRVAGSAVGVGKVVIVCGALIGVVLAVGGLISASSILAFSGVVTGLTIFGAAYVQGMLIEAVGHLLRASLDTAVNTSPLMNEAEKRRFVGM